MMKLRTPTVGNPHHCAYGALCCLVDSVVVIVVVVFFVIVAVLFVVEYLGIAVIETNDASKLRNARR